MPSAVNSYRKLRNRPPVFFLDRCLGGHMVAAKLRANSEIMVEAHHEHFAEDEKDEIILREIGKRQWIFLTKDKRIRYNPLALASIRESSARVVYLSSNVNLKGEQVGEVFLKAASSIVKIARQNNAPFVAKVTKDSKVSIVPVDWR